METKLLDAKGTSRALVRLVEEHGTVHAAVAWAGMTKATRALLASSDKFGSVLIGIDFAATDPDVIDALVDVPNAFYAASRGGCFHPKVYYFETDGRAEAIVGSANMTPGGLGANHEACVHVAGDAKQPIFGDIRRQLEGYAPLRRAITQEFAGGYRRQAEVAARTLRPGRPVLPEDGKAWRQANSRVVNMTWPEFSRAARLDPFHDFAKRMRLLRHVQALFAGVHSFADLSAAQWKGIAGVLGAAEKADTDLAELEWGWFGGMRGAGVFTGRVGARSPELAKALDRIPRQGAVTRVHFETFCSAFAYAFEGESRGGRVPTASRLLAMKRPDVFVCVNKGNRSGLARALDFAPTTLSLGNYWERLVEPIRLSAWYNRDRPGGREGELWDYRAAMLDAIFYAP